MNRAQAIQNRHKNACTQCPRASVCLSVHQQDQIIEGFEFESHLLKQGEYLCYQGQQSHNLYIIQTGVLKSTIIKSSGEEYVMGFYLPPDLFGWEGIDESHHSVSISALDQSNICVIPTGDMFLLTQKFPALGERLLRMVSRRIHQDNIALLRTTAQQRVATFLLQFELRYRALGFPKGRLQLIMTHQDIANYLRITPSTISRIFHELAEKKIIQIKKHDVQLLDIATIQMMAE